MFPRLMKNNLFATFIEVTTKSVLISFLLIIGEWDKQTAYTARVYGHGSKMQWNTIISTTYILTYNVTWCDTIQCDINTLRYVKQISADREALTHLRTAVVGSRVPESSFWWQVHSLSLSGDEFESTAFYSAQPGSNCVFHWRLMMRCYIIIARIMV